MGNCLCVADVTWALECPMCKCQGVRGSGNCGDTAICNNCRIAYSMYENYAQRLTRENKDAAIRARDAREKADPKLKAERLAAEEEYELSHRRWLKKREKEKRTPWGGASSWFPGYSGPRHPPY